MTTPQALIIDDEPDILELLEITLDKMEITTTAAETITEAKELLKQQEFDLCLTDMKLPDGDGLELVQHVVSHYPFLPIAVITAHGSVETAILAMKYGAFDFIPKPVDLTALRDLVNNALKLTTAPKRDRRSRDNLLGDSEVMRELRAKINKVSRSQAPIHISGESGTGKELIARLIHKQSSRSEQEFIAVNCGAIPAELMESEFFGHKKGSFTGAVSDKTGLFQAADGGTLFLDEVADLPLALQVKLLRAIQEKKIRPVGDQAEQTINVRILSATHKNLAQMIKVGEFRQDLFYRINVIELHAPPLRIRTNDIPQLVNHIITINASRNNINAPRLTPSAFEALAKHQFPGNVRELENILERAMALYEGDTIGVEDLGLTTVPEELTSQLQDPDPAANWQQSNSTLEDYLEDIERKMIEDVLEKNRWNKTAAAKQLGMSFRSLRYRLKKLGLD